MRGSLKVDAKKAAAFLTEHYPLVGVLIASFIASASMGTYFSWDSQLEFEAASNVLAKGFPIVTTGMLINQPPLGFYTTALIFQAIGSSYLNGVAVVSAFGLGCVAAVYALGTVLYGKRTGLVAAALFGVVPWHVYLSRIFLIDNECLFLSLLFLTLGVLAVKQNSEKLVAAAGVVFALAFLTKLFAAFALIPLAIIIYLNRKEGTFKLNRRNVLLFLLPTLVSQAIWFGGFAQQNFFAVYLPSDFTHPVLVADPQLAFLPIIFVKSAGWFLFAAAALSVALAVAFRKQLAGVLRLDVACLGTIAAVMALDMVLVFGFHLTVPYVSVIKYNYLLLPLFCLLGASLVDKLILLVSSIDRQQKNQWIKAAILGAGLVLLFASLLESTLYLNTWTGFTSFGVDSVTYYGFNVNSEALSHDVLVPLHYGALALMVASMFLPQMFGIMKRSIKVMYQALRS
jgi:4-amino-4-deoxy-L-arabinose transferase-like glycosyltransferase